MIQEVMLTLPGYYLAKFHFSMAGPWAIEIRTHADGFASIQQTLFIYIP
jgi:hypothetical protein